MLKILPIFLIPAASKIATSKTGRPVPIPYAAGKRTLELFFTESGIRLPKKNAAEIGQNERAKSIPNGTAPHMPRFFNVLAAFSEKENPKKDSWTISRRKIPATIKTGPRILFI